MPRTSPSRRIRPPVRSARLCACSWRPAARISSSRSCSTSSTRAGRARSSTTTSRPAPTGTSQSPTGPGSESTWTGNGSANTLRAAETASASSSAAGSYEGAAMTETGSNGSGRELRSHAWFSGLNMFTFSHRSWNGRGYPPDVFDGRPVIGICNSWSELTTCNAHLRVVAEHVKRGVWEAGGLPLEFPTISLGESMMKPTTMLWRNLMSMDVEESLRANPLDGVVLLCGCDKTTPAQLMGAASADLPTIVMPGGPMLSGRWRNRRLGSGTDGRKLFDLFRTGKLSEEQWCEIEGGMSRSAGHC